MCLACLLSDSSHYGPLAETRVKANHFSLILHPRLSTRLLWWWKPGYHLCTLHCQERKVEPASWKTAEYSQTPFLPWPHFPSSHKQSSAPPRSLSAPAQYQHSVLANNQLLSNAKRRCSTGVIPLFSIADQQISRNVKYRRSTGSAPAQCHRPVLANNQLLSNSKPFYRLSLPTNILVML